MPLQYQRSHYKETHQCLYHQRDCEGDRKKVSHCEQHHPRAGRATTGGLHGPSNLQFLPSTSGAPEIPVEEGNGSPDEEAVEVAASQDGTVALGVRRAPPSALNVLACMSPYAFMVLGKRLAVLRAAAWPSVVQYSFKRLCLSFRLGLRKGTSRAVPTGASSHG